MSEESTPTTPPGPLAGLRPVLLLLGVAAAVAAGVGIALWSQEPDYRALASNLSDADLAEVTATLKASDIKYKFGGDGSSVLVPANLYGEARMKTAGKGVSAATGLASLEKDQGFGVSQFMENARYQRALQQELEQVIGSLESVQQASVILAVPQQSAFVRDRRRVSASVTLTLRAGRQLGREQVDSIVNLVASSVPELTADEVTVVDSQGHLLKSPDKNNEYALRDQQMDLARRMGLEYSHSIESLLTPLLGPGRVRASVVAQLEMASTEEAREQYRPESQVVRSEQTSEEQSRGGAGAQGIPGALTNQPPEGGTAQPPGTPSNANARNGADGTQAGAAPGNESKQATRNYEIDRTVAYTRQPAGRLQRLTVAVLIDNQRTTGADGKVTEAPISPELLTRITSLVRDAVGFDEARGDRVSVVNQSFLPDSVAAAGALEVLPLWERPMVREIAKLACAFIVLVLLLLFVLRPLVKNVTALTKSPSPLPVLPGAAVAVVGATAGAAPGATAGPASAASVETVVATNPKVDPVLAYEQQIAQARSLVARDPERVAQVVKDWVQKDEQERK